MFERRCTYVADRHPRCAHRVQAGHPRYAASYDMLVQAIHDWALCPPAHRTARYEFAVSCLTRALYGAPSLLTPTYSRALKAHVSKCRRLPAEEWCDAVVIALREAHRRAADASTLVGYAAAWSTDVHVH